MPSIASHLAITIPREQAMEIDGIPLTGKIDLYDLNAVYADKKLTVTWKPVEKKGTAKIWLATTNEFKKGGTDEYIMMKQVPLTAGKAIIDVSNKSSEFYKVVMDTPAGFQNRWVIIK
jgi:hypothetical protein